ncbi:MAG: UDP-N-acetylmuramoyl-tripeptide--D-alanyl-D-alanine ligase [Chloroflexi bacterium]|nr:UDP-N-acetylmuramoyl-tripeptide--D-alanyl-D-alanine ligase [Chloroflexota bacterium]
MSDASSPSPAGRAAPADGLERESLSAGDLVALTAGRLIRDSLRPVLGAAVDSRLVRPGELFVALPGARTDGHRFLREAVVAGAAALLVTGTPDSATLAALGDVTIVATPDPLSGLQALAAAWRSRFSPLVVGVTGSIAKTSTKEAIAVVLGARGRTLRTEGNQNNEIGVPLALLRLGSDDVHVVLEMGMYATGEIAHLATLARPEIGVVTAVLPVHLSRIGSIQAVEDAKAELVEALPSTGVAVLNADDPRVRTFGKRTRARVVTYGFSPDADFRAERVRSAGAAGMRFDLRQPGTRGAIRAAVSIPALGRLSVHNALAAAAVGAAAGLSLGEVVAALSKGWSAAHRGELISVGGLTIIDDSYNASPASMMAALELLAGLPGRKVAVLGEMLELGDQAPTGHHETGEAAADVAELLIVIGDGAAEIAAGARAAGMPPGAVVEVADRTAALAELEFRLRRRDVVLVKASRGAELDLLVDELKRSLA